MIEPKEQALKIFNDIDTALIDVDAYHSLDSFVKQISIYHVDGILSALDSDRIIYGSLYRYEESEYWEEVKKEIEQL